MNKVKKKVYRNTTSFNMMAWGIIWLLRNLDVGRPLYP